MLEFSATFQPVNDQAVGLGNDLSDFPYAIFTTGLNGDPFMIYAPERRQPASRRSTRRSRTSACTCRTGSGSSGPRAPIRYYVDGALVATHAIAIDQEIRPVISDYGLFGAAVKVDWIRMSTYASTGTFTSRVLDSGPGANDWATLTPHTTLPTGTSITYQTRSGATPTPDASWSGWQSLGTGNAIASPNSRFLQYRATLHHQHGRDADPRPRPGHLRRGHRPGTQHRYREPFAVRAEDEPDRHGDAERLH